MSGRGVGMGGGAGVHLGGNARLDLDLAPKVSAKPSLVACTTETAEQYDAEVGRLMRTIRLVLRTCGRETKAKHVCDALLTLLVETARDRLEMSQAEIEEVLMTGVREVFPVTKGEGSRG